uniref:Uncharacterized protein n=1 Tax=Anguilla anguilla TaxID=7936 RepID=A0A0E9VL33_ANGAN
MMDNLLLFLFIMYMYERYISMTQLQN